METGLSYFGARYYSSDLSIWLSVDPMSDKYPSLSPYVYCANNPVKLVDPNGEEIDSESMSTWNTLRAIITFSKNLYSISAKLEKETNGVLCKGASDSYSSLNKTLITMDQLENSSQMYRLSKVSGNTGDVCLNEDLSLTINFCNTANFIHEVTHCGQFERGDIGFQLGAECMAFSDIYDELEAYSAQAAFDPSSLPVNRKQQLTVDWLLRIRDKNKDYIYGSCGRQQYDGNATAEDLNMAIPFLHGDLFHFEGKLKNQQGVYFKK